MGRFCSLFIVTIEAVSYSLIENEKECLLILCVLLQLIVIPVLIRTPGFKKSNIYLCHILVLNTYYMQMLHILWQLKYFLSISGESAGTLLSMQYSKKTETKILYIQDYLL